MASGHYRYLWGSHHSSSHEDLEIAIRYKASLALAIPARDSQ
jgi:hypothetical protein